jgi:hypothetical protein
MVRYQALLMAAMVEARALAWSKRPHEQIAELMDCVHNLPDLLCRWSDMDEQSILRDLLRYEKKYHAGKQMLSRILLEGPPERWQQRWTAPTG